VIINLFDNAVAALAGKPQNLAKKIEILTHYHDQLQMVAIEVIDNGLGMTDEVKARVFEPYFSTKTGGTGLGLAIVKRIINDHNGFIRVRSAPNEGTQFLIELPSAIRQGLEKMRGESPQS
jgi:two-component system nitrogen regulation sensor histidine kinase NtrY